MTMAVPDRRSTVQHRAEGLQYEIPAPRSIFAIVFLPLWLVGWAFGEVFAIRTLIYGGKAPQLFLIAWLALWTFGGCTALYSWLAQVLGKEIVSLSHSTLTIQRNVTGFEKAKEYDLTHVRNLRAGEPSRDYFRRRQMSTFAAGTIAFDYGAKTFRFGAGVDEAEAAMIIAELKNYHAFSA